MRMNTINTAISDTKQASAARVRPTLCPRVKQCKVGFSAVSDSFHSAKLQITPDVGGGGHDALVVVEVMREKR
jgi:hypothetical protein